MTLLLKVKTETPWRFLKCPLDAAEWLELNLFRHCRMAKIKSL